MYYLHHCATTTASWLTDYDVDQCVVRSYRTATTSASLVMLVPLYGHVYDADADVMWCLESAHHYLWMVELFHASCARATKQKFKSLQHDVIAATLRRLAGNFPDAPERTPDPFTERAAYAAAHCLSAWVRVPPPFWAAPPPRIPRTHRQQHTPSSNDDDLFADLR